VLNFGNQDTEELVGQKSPAPTAGLDTVDDTDPLTQPSTVALVEEEKQAASGGPLSFFHPSSK